MQPTAGLLVAAFALCASCQSSNSPVADAASDSAGEVEDAATGPDGAVDAASDATADTGATPDTGSSTDAGDTGDAQAGDDASPEDAAADSSVQDSGTVDGPLRSFVYVGAADWSGADYPFRGYALDRDALTLSELPNIPTMGQNPSFIAPGKDGRHLYIANAYGAGGVTVASVDPATGALAQVDFETGPGGGGFVFSEVSPDGQHVLATSYNGGFVAVYPVLADATLNPMQQRLDFGGGAQSHSVRVHPNGKYAFVPNKGLNSVAQLRMDATTGTLSHNSTDDMPAPYDAPQGPRHIALSGDGSQAFLIQELSNEVRSLAVGTDGKLSPLDTKPRLPADFTGGDSGAHILVHPNGKFLYASNRGSNTIVVFAIAPSGELTLLEHESTRGGTPRNFDIDVRGEILVVANQDSGSLAVFSIGEDGGLTPVGEPVTGLPSPQAVSIVSFPDTP